MYENPLLITAASSVLLLLGACRSAVPSTEHEDKSAALTVVPAARTQSRPRVAAAENDRPAQVQTPDADRRLRPATHADSEAASRRERERQREVVRVQRALEMAQLELAKARIDKQNGELKQPEELKGADFRLELANRRLEAFKEFLAPARLARAEFELKKAEDLHREDQEELEQLEQMYKENPTEDQAQEVVLGRARRRLALAARDLELRRREFETLKDVTLVIERRDLEYKAEQARQAALNVQRDNESALLDRKIALISAEMRVTELEHQLAGLEEQLGRVRESGNQERQPLSEEPQQPTENLQRGVLRQAGNVRRPTSVAGASGASRPLYGYESSK